MIPPRTEIRDYHGQVWPFASAFAIVVPLERVFPAPGKGGSEEHQAEER